MYKCVIIDDELHAITGLKRFIEYVPEIEIVETFLDPILAMKTLSVSARLDLIFLDVDMPGISGIELSRVIRHKTDKLIFTTAHSKYGYEAFEVNADAYLLKPYSLSKFLEIINRNFPLISQNVSEKVQEDFYEDFFFVKSKEDNLKLVRIDYQKIIAIESKLNYIRIHLATRNILTYMSLSEISKKLAKRKEFIQFQRSFILNKAYMELIDGNTIKMTSGFCITVGDYYRKEFNEFIEKNLMKAKRKN